MLLSGRDVDVSRLGNVLRSGAAGSLLREPNDPLKQFSVVADSARMGVDELAERLDKLGS